MDTNKMYVKDDQGNEKEMTILFTFEKGKKKYVVYSDPSNEEEVFASAYNEDGELFPIESDEEWDMVEEVLGAFEGDEDGKQ